MILPGIFNQKKNEEIIHISQSSMTGITLDSLYVQVTGKNVNQASAVRFIVDVGVDIVASNTSSAALSTGTTWGSNTKLTLENHGRILGHGGDGGSPARMPTLGTYYDSNKGPISALSFNDIMAHLTPAGNGNDGGLAINAATKLIVNNYSIIAGGGGGGGGSGLVGVKTPYFSSNGSTSALADATKPWYDWFFLNGAGGMGGGAPFGNRWPVYLSVTEAVDKFGLTNLISFLPDTTAYAFSYETARQNFVELTSTIAANVNRIINTDNPRPSSINNSSEFSFGSNRDDYSMFQLSPSYPTDNKGSWARLDPLPISTNADISVPGQSGSGMSMGILLAATMSSESVYVSTNTARANTFRNYLMTSYGGAGGGYGSNGGDGVLGTIYDYDLNVLDINNTSLFHFVLQPGKGGNAGYISQGNVTINNLSGGQSVGRT